MPLENNDEARAAADAFIAKAAEFVSRLAAKSPRRMTTAEMAAAALDLTRLCVTTLEAVGAFTGEQKKAATMRALEYLFDTLADRCVPSFAAPVWWLAKPAFRAIYMAAMDGAVERILAMVRDAASRQQSPGNGSAA